MGMQAVVSGESLTMIMTIIHLRKLIQVGERSDRVFTSHLTRFLAEPV
jgi:hypothetical protein